MKVLITGGAGFVGSFLAEKLHKQGYEVRIFDNFEPQVHAAAQRNIANLLEPNGQPRRGVEVLWGDLRCMSQVDCALNGVDIVVHLAAQVGVGQSMYQVHRYVDHNTVGTAVLLDLLAKRKNDIKKLLVASSMSIYGEGEYECSTCGRISPHPREAAQLQSAQWEVRCPSCSRVAAPKGTSETKPVLPTSIYAITKRDQEEMCLVVGRAYGIPTVALRFFNIYGPRQSLNNPYTGVAAIFSSRLLNNRPPVVFEDGNQTRDFVHVSDIVQAIILSLEKEEANGQVFNVGTGSPTTVRQVADLLCRKLKRDLEPHITSGAREGDIRHCYADITKISHLLGYKPTVMLEEGINDLIGWVEKQSAEDRFEDAAAELRLRGLAA